VRARANSNRGFTLVELMVVLALIAIFSGLMFAEMRGSYEDSLLRFTARKIMGAANLANSKAVSSNRAHALVLDPAEGRLAILVEGERRPVEEGKLDTRIQLEVREVSAPSEDDPEEPREARDEKKRELDRIQFLPDGTADARDILLRDRQGVELALRINPVTGRVRVLEDEVGR
jgi:type II secretion system protein H